jgi:hypothetical protein
LFDGLEEPVAVLPSPKFQEIELYPIEFVRNDIAKGLQGFLVKVKSFFIAHGGCANMKFDRMVTRIVKIKFRVIRNNNFECETN